MLVDQEHNKRASLVKVFHVILDCGKYWGQRATSRWSRIQQMVENFNLTTAAVSFALERSVN